MSPVISARADYRYGKGLVRSGAGNVCRVAQGFGTYCRMSASHLNSRHAAYGEESRTNFLDDGDWHSHLWFVSTS